MQQNRPMYTAISINLQKRAALRSTAYKFGSQSQYQNAVQITIAKDCRMSKAMAARVKVLSRMSYKSHGCTGNFFPNILQNSFFRV